MPVAEDSVTLDLLSRHVIRWTLGLGTCGIIAALVWKGPVNALSFALGVAGALFNIWFFRGVALALGTTGETPLRASKVLLILRILLIGLGTFAILKTSEIVVPALLLGLLASAAAVILEILYLLIFYART